MKRSKLIIGAAILTVAGAAVGRASKFAAPAKIYYTKAGVCTQLTSSVGTTPLTTNSASGTAAFLRTAATIGQHNYKLFATINAGACAKPLFVTP